MKIYFVRHGYPDYGKDCLTELGHKQAAAAAERLQACGIEQIFSSTKGRALETAEHTAKKLGLPVIPCDFMREINWGAANDEPILADGHPWALVNLIAAEGKSIRDHDWAMGEHFCNNKVVACTKTVTDGLDAWMSELGYVREGDYYRVVGENTNRSVAMFSHGGASTAALAHLFNLPFPQACGMLHVDFTSVTVVSLPDRRGELVYPKLVASDATHTAGLEIENMYGK